MKKYRFTLVEILVATGIIAILAAMGFAGYRLAVDSGRENNTKMLITQITTALDNCKNKVGFYPAAENYGDITFTFEEKPNGDKDAKLKSVSFSGTIFKNLDSGAKKKFFDLFTKALDIEQIKSACGSDNVLCDSWGNPVKYKFPGSINPTKYDVISAGADGKFGQNNKTEPVTSKSDYIDDSGERLCDDVANF